MHISRWTSCEPLAHTAVLQDGLNDAAAVGAVLATLSGAHAPLHGICIDESGGTSQLGKPPSKSGNIQDSMHDADQVQPQQLPDKQHRC